MRSLDEIMDKMIDAKAGIESMQYLTEFLVQNCKEHGQEDNVKILGCYNAMLKQTEKRINEALEMIDLNIMEEKSTE